MGDKTRAQLAQELRDEYDVADGVSDDDLVTRYLQKNPDKVKDMKSVAPNPRSGRPMRGSSALARFGKGMGAQPLEMAKGLGTFKGAAQLLFPQFGIGQEDFLKKLAEVYQKDPEQAKQMAKDHFESLVDLPNIGDDIHKGDWAHAAGRATTQALAWVSAMFGGESTLEETGTEALGKMNVTGKGMKVSDAALDAAKVATTKQSAFLDAEINAMRTGMKTHFVDVQGLRAAIAKPAKIIEDIERAPSMQVKDITAAKDVVSRLADRVQKGMMTWPEAQGFMKELNNAAKATKGASQLRDSLYATRQAVDDTVTTAAKKAGYGEAYTQWKANERTLNNLQRAHAKITDKTTLPQLRADASSGPGIGIPRTGIRVGGRGVQRAGKKMLKSWDKALNKFDEQLGIPKKPGAGGAGPAPGGGGGVQAAPVTPPGGAAKPMPPVGGGSGQWHGPMSGAVDKVAGPPVSETQQAINDILRPNLPKNLVVGEQMGAKITQPGTGPAQVIPFRRNPPPVEEF